MVRPRVAAEPRSFYSPEAILALPQLLENSEVLTPKLIDFWDL